MPINVFKGGFCPVYEESVGRVVEDYNTPCFDCHKGFDSYDYFKCKITTSLYISTINLYVQARFKLKIRLLILLLV